MKHLIILFSILLLPFTVVAQDFCEGNFDYDDDQDGTDAVQFKTDFGRHQYNNSCPPDGPAPVPQTGATLSDRIHDDGYLKSGVPWPQPRFTDNGDGTIRDNLTGLIWMKKADCFFANSNWEQSVDGCATLNSGECEIADDSVEGEWKLPNVRELHSLIDYNNTNPALPEDHLFEGIQLGSYWSSTPYRTDVYYYFRVQFTTGKVYEAPLGNGYPVLCVKGYSRFKINGNGTVTDKNTGLVWLENAFCDEINATGNGLNWDDANTILTTLSSGQCGLTDGSVVGEWRLPTKDEWERFICPEYTNPSVCNRLGVAQWSEGDPFNSVQPYLYWSSTELNATPPSAWMADVDYGYTSGTAKSAALYVWPVRGGQ